MTQIGTFSSSGILTMARGRNGDLYGVNGLERGFRWDGKSASVEQLGISAPTSTPTVTPSVESGNFFIRDVEVIDGGFGFVAPPEVTITDPAAGTTAKAKSEIVGASVSRILMRDYGSGYVAPPTVTVAAPTGDLGGSGASLTAVMTNTITRVVRGQPGSGYSQATPPEVRVGHVCSGNKDTDAITLNAHGLEDGDTVYFLTTAGGLSSSTLYYVVNAATNTFKVSTTSGGSAVDITATFSASTQQVQPAPGKISGAFIEAQVDANGKLKSLIIVDGGSGFTPSYRPALRIGAGGGATAVAYLSLAVDSVTVNSGGSNYLTGTPLRFLSPTGSGAAGEIVATSGAITSVTLLQGGSYVSAPSVEVDKPRRLVVKPAVVSPVLIPGIAGRFWCAYRYVDSSGIPSNISDIAVVDVNTPTLQLTWSGLASGEARAACIELWRTTADQALTMYRVATLPASATTYLDTLDDATLSNPERTLICTASASTDIVTCAGHGMADGSTVKFISLTGGAGLTANVNYYVVSSTATTFKVSATKGGAPINITTNMTAGTVVTDAFAVLPVVQDDGRPSALRHRIPPQNKSTVVMFQDRAWYAVDSAGRKYDGTADSTYSEPNTLYYSEIDEPESVPETNELVIQDNVNGADRITALMPYGGSLIVFQEQHCHRLTYSVDPITEASVVLIAQRGCLNQRCFGMVDGVAYVADSAGIYAFNGDNAEPISGAIENFWSNGIIHFASSQNFFLRCDPATKIVRFYFSVSAGLPDRALCYHPVTQAWWLEQYPQTVGAAGLVRYGSRQRELWGLGNGSVVLGDSGYSDIASNGDAQAIACQIRTGVYAFDIPGGDRRIRIIYKPTPTDATLSLKLHFNNSPSPRPLAITSDRGSGFTSTQAGAAELNMKVARSALEDSNGYAACYYSGRLDDRSSGGDRHMALDMSAAAPSDSNVLLYGTAIVGVSV